MRAFFVAARPQMAGSSPAMTNLKGNWRICDCPATSAGGGTQAACRDNQRRFVIPAQAGIQGKRIDFHVALDSRLRGSDDLA
jgi:hypothetical protein